MVSSSCMTIPIPNTRKTQKLMRKFKWKVWSHHSLDMAPNLDSKHLSGTSFSSDSDVKSAAENWLNGQGCDFCQAGLNKRSDKYLNRFGDYMEK
ncbi:hypothetical protein AVEN_208216-1 [Araneus ventricosus]|uniref:Uncharacterized protein n=1 Tax=Araneus ventricosus TaxID=182803 RepID=A0A4Y1ZPW7_ARAVE|nr:hypothetical protein AVEN_208216-1 [Araneus ventricosus]